MPIEIHQFPCLSDNYGYLIHDTVSGETACVDTPDGAECLAQAAGKGWRISQVWNTHWHKDHAGGNLAVKAAAGCVVTAPAGDAGKIEGVDRVVDQGDTVALGGFRAQVLNVGGHTLGHVAYYLPEAGPDKTGVCFVGDALFALGCGRMFEGTAEQFWASLERLRGLPGETMIYCAHEYSASNARFARHVDPDNAELADYEAEILARRAQGLATVPFRLDREGRTNPFLRADAPGFGAAWGAGAVAAFAALREAKNSF
jgi:hydroxyacylglutathione hydrolase